MKCIARCKIAMREIDFLPKWYESSRRRQVGYRAQYIALGGIFVVMVVWSFIADGSISKTTAELAQMATRQAKAESASQEFARIKNEVAGLKKKLNILEEVDSQIDVASVLDELGFLIDEEIVLKKLVVSSEKLAGSCESSQPATANAVQSLLDDVRFKVVMSGLAVPISGGTSGQAIVAELVCRLEDSPCFCRVRPLFSRNAGLKAGTRPAEGSCQASEFEISCYLADYRHKEKN